MLMKVRVNGLYVFNAVGLDITDPKCRLPNGTVVRVKNMHGCPPANTMGQCYIFTKDTDEFIGMVSTASLSKPSKGVQC
jgi:hypothetical protein